MPNEAGRKSTNFAYGNDKCSAAHRLLNQYAKPSVTDKTSLFEICQ